MRVKLVKDGDETYVLARSEGRRDKEQGMRRRGLRKLIKRLRQLKARLAPATSSCSSSARRRKRLARPMDC